jgi:hypothetical protein
MEGPEKRTRASARADGGGRSFFKNRFARCARNQWNRLGADTPALIEAQATALPWWVGYSKARFALCTRNQLGSEPLRRPNQRTDVKADAQAASPSLPADPTHPVRTYVRATQSCSVCSHVLPSPSLPYTIF